MNHAVGSHHVGGDDVRALDRRLAVSDLEGDGCALERGGGQAVLDGGSLDFTGHDVVEQDVAQRLRVFEQAFDRAGGQCANAASVGAKTVNGPLPWSASTRPAACTAATSVLNWPAPIAVATMSFEPQGLQPGCGGRSGRQDDLVDDVNHAVGSHHVGGDDVRALDHGLPSVILKATGEPCSVVGGQAVLDGGSLDFTGHDVVEQDVAQRLRVLQQALDGAGGQLRKRRIRGGEDRERALALERLNQAGCLHGRHQRLELAGADRRRYDVLRCRRLWPRHSRW